MTINVTNARPRNDAGFSLIEVMISTLIFTVISGVVISGMLSMNNINTVVGNRTEMHSGVRNATELMQQEVGQAGRAVLPQEVQLAAAVVAEATTMTLEASDAGSTIAPTVGMFDNMFLIVGIDENRETVQIASMAGNDITLLEAFLYPHPAGSPVAVSGGFAEGIVPPTMPDGSARPDGSTGTVLKMIGDVQSNGSMVYIEYTCDTVNHKLYRNVVAWDAASKPAVTESMVLLDNLMPNPDGTDCFTYQTAPIAAGETTTAPGGVVATTTGSVCVVGVAITLTVRTQDIDPNTGDYQTETKALLNVAPRNVFNVWQIASLGGLEFRVQPLPLSVVTDLLPALVAEDE